MDFKEFDETSKDLLDRLKGRMSEENDRYADDYWGHGEWGLLMEVVLDALVEEEIPISPDEYGIVQRLVMHFEPDNYHEFTNRREDILASLNVIEEGES